MPARLQVLNLAGGERNGGGREGGGEKQFECQGCGLQQCYHCPYQAQVQGALRKCAFCDEVQEVEDAEVEEIEESEAEEEEWGELMVQQHWAMSKLIGQEMALIDGTDDDQRIWMKTLTKLHEERERLEEEILEA